MTPEMKKPPKPAADWPLSGTWENGGYLLSHQSNAKLILKRRVVVSRSSAR